MTRLSCPGRMCVRHNAIHAAVVILILAGGQSASAALVSINFDNLFANPLSAAGNPVTSPARLSNQLASLGVLFASSNPYVAVVNLGTGTTSPNNAIGGTIAPGLISYSVPITLEFVSPLDPTIPAVTDFVSIKGDTNVSAMGTNTMIALDIDGNPVAYDVRIEPPAVTLSVSAPGIHSVIIIGSGSTAFDDLSFHTVSAVPEPTTLVLSLTGMVFLFAVARSGRRSRVAQIPALRDSRWANLTQLGR